MWSRTGSRLRAGRLDRSERKARAHDVWRAAGNEAGRGRADQPSLTLTRAFVFCRKYQSTNRQSSARARNLLFNIKYLDLVPSHRRMILLINTAREHEVGSLDASAGGRRRCLLHPCCHRTPPFLENERAQSGMTDAHAVVMDFGTNCRPPSCESVKSNYGGGGGGGRRMCESSPGLRPCGRAQSRGRSIADVARGRPARRVSDGSAVGGRLPQTQRQKKSRQATDFFFCCTALAGQAFFSIFPFDFDSKGFAPPPPDATSSRRAFPVGPLPSVQGPRMPRCSSRVAKAADDTASVRVTRRPSGYI